MISKENEKMGASSIIFWVIIAIFSFTLWINDFREQDKSSKVYLDPDPVHYEKDKSYYLVTYRGVEYYGKEGKWFVESTGRRISPAFKYNLHKELDAVLRVALRDGKVDKIKFLDKFK